MKSILWYWHTHKNQQLVENIKSMFWCLDNTAGWFWLGWSIYIYFTSVAEMDSTCLEKLLWWNKIKNAQKVKQNAFSSDKTRQNANFQANLILQSHEQYKKHTDNLGAASWVLPVGCVHETNIPYIRLLSCAQPSGKTQLATAICLFLYWSRLWRRGFFRKFAFCLDLSD